MELDGSIAKFTDDELQAMGGIYPESIHVDAIDADALIIDIERRKSRYYERREEHRDVEWTDGPGHVGDVTEEAIKLAKDTDLIAGIVTVLHLHQLGMNVEGVGDGVPND